MRFALVPLSVLVAAAVSGCGSRSSVELSADQTCVELNRTVADSAARISNMARSRGRAETFNLPSWLSPAERVRQSRVDRYSREIDEQRAVQEQAKAELLRRCSRHE
jgi:hypothetical protein